MPVYEVEDPQGRTLEIEGDHVPTAEELTNIFTQAFPAPAQAAQAQPAPERPALVRAPLPTMGPQGQQMLQTGMEQLSKPLVNIPAELATPPLTQLIPSETIQKAGQAMGQESAQALSSLTSPLGLATIPAMMVLPEVVGPAMAASMAPQVAEGAKETWKGITSADIPETMRGLTKGTIALAGVAGGLIAPFHGRLLPKSAKEVVSPSEEPVVETPSPAAEPVAAPPKIAAVEQQARRAEIKSARPEVPETPPEPERGLSVIQEIREKGANTRRKVQELFPSLSNETAAKLRDQAFPRVKVPDNLSRTEVDRLFLDKLNKESNEEIANATRIREDEGQVPESGVQLESRQAEGGPDLERSPQVQPSGTTPPKEAEVAKPAQRESLETFYQKQAEREAAEEAKSKERFEKSQYRAAIRLPNGKVVQAASHNEYHGDLVALYPEYEVDRGFVDRTTGEFLSATEVARRRMAQTAPKESEVAKPPPLSTAERAEVQAELSQALGEEPAAPAPKVEETKPAKPTQKPPVEFPPVEKGPQAEVFESEVKAATTEALEEKVTQLKFHLDQLKYGVRAAGVTKDMEARWRTDWERQLKFINNEISRRTGTTKPKGEMRPGAQPYDPSSGALGIKPPVPRSLRVFATQDVAPFIRKGVDLVRATKDMVINAFSPASHAKTADVDILFKSKGYSEKLMTQAGAVLEHANDLLKSRPRAEQIAFIDRVKRGQSQPTPELQDIADLIRDWDDRLYAEAKVYKPNLDYLDNHLRVLWKTIPGKTKRGLSQEQIISKRPWRGSQGFTKRHVLDDMSQGIALGGEPVTYNPVEMFLLHAQDVMKFVSANRAWESLKGTGEVTFVKLGKQAPDDFVRIKDSIAKAYFSPKGMKGVRAQAGEWWVQKDAARMIENYLSRDYIRSSVLGRALMGLKNITTAIELGLSPFHAVFESLETIGSTFGLGLSKITSGDLVGGLKNILETPFAPKTVSKLGRAGIKYAKDAAGFQAAEPEAYNWFVSKFPAAKSLLDDLFTGGGQLGMHQDYKWRAGSGFSQALQEGNYPGAVLRSVPAINQVAMKPLFETYIPRLKVGTFLREYAFQLTRHSDEIASGKLTREQLARETWAFVEDRFGEMNFDNLYWDRTFKSAMQLAFRSVTWKLGNLRGFGKAARDATAELGWKWFTEGRAPEMTLPMAWTIGMSVTTGIVSSLVTKAATGKYPWELAKDMGDLVKNLVFPRISLTDESQRVSTPTYWRDAVHLSHSVPDYIKSSMSGEKGRIMDVWNNRDFYGVQVMNPDDPLPKKVAQAFQHLVPVPFGASSWLAAERTGATKGQALAGFFGFTKAPYYVSHTDAEQKAMELMRAGMRQGSRTREEFERSIRERQAVEAIKRGDMTGPEAVRDGLVEQRRIKQVESRATEPLLEHLVGRLGPDDAMRVYKSAAPEEKDRIKFRIQQKILRSRTLDPARKGDLLIELER